MELCLSGLNGYSYKEDVEEVCGRVELSDWYDECYCDDEELSDILFELRFECENESELNSLINQLQAWCEKQGIEVI